MPGAILAIGLIYYYAPNHDVRLRDVWRRAAGRAALARRARGFLVSILRAFARYGVHGSIGAVIAFLVWVFLSAVILLCGVEVTAAYAIETRTAGFLTVVFSNYHLPLTI